MTKNKTPDELEAETLAAFGPDASAVYTIAKGFAGVAAGPLPAMHGFTYDAPSAKRDVFKPPPWIDQLGDDEIGVLDPDGLAVHRAPLGDAPPSAIAYDYFKPRPWLVPKGHAVAWSGLRPCTVPLDDNAFFSARHEHDAPRTALEDFHEWIAMELVFHGWAFVETKSGVFRGLEAVRMRVPVGTLEIMLDRAVPPGAPRAHAHLTAKDLARDLAARLEPTCNGEPLYPLPATTWTPATVPITEIDATMQLAGPIGVVARCTFCGRSTHGECENPDAFARKMQAEHLLCALRKADPQRYDPETARIAAALGFPPGTSRRAMLNTRMAPPRIKPPPWLSPADDDASFKIRTLFRSPTAPRGPVVIAHNDDEDHSSRGGPRRR